MNFILAAFCAYLIVLAAHMIIIAIRKRGAIEFRDIRAKDSGWKH